MEKGKNHEYEAKQKTEKEAKRPVAAGADGWDLSARQDQEQNLR